MMDSGFYYVVKMKITNFLSFFGNHEVDLLPFTAITCNYPEGKDDMIRATEFVFGANLEEMSIENPKNLLHKALWKEYDELKEILCFVEVTLNSVSDDKNLKFHRGVKKRQIEYRINGELVSISDYEEWLNALNLNIKSKNIILHKSFFNNVIWGTPEDLETVITKILRVDSCSSEWKKAMAKVEDLRETKNFYTFERILQKIKKSHAIVEKFVDHFNSFVTRRDYILTSIAEEGLVEVSESLPAPTSSGKTVEDENFNLEKVQMLQDKYESLLDNYKALEMRENKLEWEMYLLELKISSNPLKTDIWQGRIKALKEKLRKYEDFLSTLWAKTKEVDRQLHEISFEISANLAVLQDLGRSHYLKNRLTKYGRLIDYLQPNIFVELLRKILGDNILYGNLCDDMKTAVSCLQHLKATGYEGRETFLIFENHSSELKDLLLATTEDGIRLNSKEDLLIFLCKLKKYGLIAKVPVISEERFDFESEERVHREKLQIISRAWYIEASTSVRRSFTEDASILAKHLEFFPMNARCESEKFKDCIEQEKYYENDIMYPEDGIFFRYHGKISYCSETGTDTDTDVKTETIAGRINQLMIKQELKNEKYTSLIFQRFEAVNKMVNIENDILRLKKLKRHKPRHFAVSEKLPLPDVYKEYSTNFEECDRSMKFSEELIITSQEFLSVDTSRISPHSDDRVAAQMEDTLNDIRINSHTIEEEKAKVKNELKKIETKLKQSRVFSNKVSPSPFRKYFLLEHPKRTCSFYYDMELEKCRALMSSDEINEFESWKDWRKEIINSMGKKFGTDASLLKALEREVDDLAMTRKRTLAPILEHCNGKLSSAINFIMDASLPFLCLDMDQNGLQLLSSLSRNRQNVIEISHLNTFLKFLVALSLFLEMANYDRVPLLLLDNVKEFLPMDRDSYEGELGSVSSNENINFQMITRITHYLNFFIDKNKHETKKGGNGKKGHFGPVQIIYFTSDDLVHAAQCHLWIRNNLLPDEYISEACDSYSAIENIQFG